MHAWKKMILTAVMMVPLGTSAQTAVTTTVGGTVTTTSTATYNSIPMFTTGSNLENSMITEVTPTSTSSFKQININYGSLLVDAGTSNGGMVITSNQPVTTTSNGTTSTQYWQMGYRFGQDSATFQRGLLYDQQSGRVSVINTNATGASLETAISERLTVLPSGNVGVGTTTPAALLEVSGNAQMDGNIKMTGTGASITFPDGTVQGTAYTGVTCGGDYAETVDVAGDRKNYEPGDVLVLDQNIGSDVLKSSEPYSTLVAGIYSTKPGVVGRRQKTDAKTSTTEVPMAMVGIVPTKVSAENGPIKRGDLLVTSSMLGYAMKGTDRSRMLGAVVGKALGALDSGTGVIEVLVTLQ